MAAKHQRKRVLFVVDFDKDNYFVFKVNLKDLFSDADTVPPPQPPVKTEVEMVPLPGPPIAFFIETEVIRGHIAFAVSGTTIVGLGMKRTFTYDTSSNSHRSGPRTGAKKHGALLLPVGAEIYALSTYPRFDPDARPHFEAITPREPAVAWRALPEPPPEPVRLNPDRIGRDPICLVGTWLASAHALRGPIEQPFLKRKGSPDALSNL